MIVVFNHGDTEDTVRFEHDIEMLRVLESETQMLFELFSVSSVPPWFVKNP
jgi:hypothetical protein